ncbi:RluA family pseudouridine synthase [Thermodesulfovibrio thiophilus]|uniref:RluA family pseudouridine synthase n=1 Tax=Thermodesulfovibrio thiophilus TaxID=340095 RepID=UPI001845BD82|nr:RluA family pseudouridine synthase [Thermodesulfovibrio thiophilus]HHW20186.1 RluA family pseudouridine synthase [Thermodesulfovibrio thiophilus]
MSISLIIHQYDKDKRLDICLSEQLKITRAKAQELIEKEFVKVNGVSKSKSYKLKLNDLVEVIDVLYQSVSEQAKLIPQNIPINIIYKDDYLVVLSKPAGMVVYPCPGHKDGSLMNALAYHISKLASIGGPLRPGVVHRLDKDTSGIMVVALNDKAYYKLVEIFKKREVKKEYIALVYGELNGSGEIVTPIGRAIHDRKKMSIKSKKAKEAQTNWEVLKSFKNYTLVKTRIITGRTHQIRVHFSSIGHPILGDKTYGKKTYLELGRQKIFIPRQMLHAQSIEFIHPVKGDLLQFEDPLPEDMNEIIKILSSA